MNLLRPHIKPFDINDYAHRKVRHILVEEGCNQDLVHTIRDHYFGHSELVTFPATQAFIKDVEASEFTVGEFIEFDWNGGKAANDYGTHSN